MEQMCRIVYGVGCELVYVTGGVESCMGCDARSCMEQVVWNRVLGWGARSCMEQVVSNRVWG
jgi:hypothetical protein